MAKKIVKKKAAVKAKKKPAVKKVAVKKTAPKKASAKKIPVKAAASNKVNASKKVTVKRSTPIKIAKKKNTSVVNQAVPEVVEVKPKLDPPKLSVVSTPTAPTRAPMRRVFGAGNKITIVPKRMPEENLTQTTTVTPTPITVPVQEEQVETSSVKVKAPMPTIQEAPKLVVKAPPPPAPLPKLAWSELPKNYPAPVKFLLSMAKKECDSASTWPFSFAKFVTSLPQVICGREFGLLFMSLERSNEEIASACKLKPEEVEAILVSAENNIKEAFDSTCPEIARKCRTQLAGTGMGLESFIEQYVVSKVDRNFQVMLGAMLLKAMGAKASTFDAAGSAARYANSL